MRSYGQLCAVARALDLVGDRWTLLIVRELLIADRARFTDLQRGLPGIAPNLLAQRLRELTEHGLVRREPLPPPAGGSGYRLTDRGRALDGVLRELLRWGAATVPEAPEDARFQMHWLSMPARFLLRDRDPDADPVVVRFGDLTDGFDATADGEVTITPCRPDVAPQAEVAGPGLVLVGLIQGAVSITKAVEAGVTITGDRAALARVLKPPQARETREGP